LDAGHRDTISPGEHLCLCLRSADQRGHHQSGEGNLTKNSHQIIPLNTLDTIPLSYATAERYPFISTQVPYGANLSVAEPFQYLTHSGTLLPAVFQQQPAPRTQVRQGLGGDAAQIRQPAIVGDQR